DVAMSHSVVERIPPRDLPIGKHLLLHFRIIKVIQLSSCLDLFHTLRIITDILITADIVIPFIDLLLTNETSTVVLLIDIIIESMCSTISLREHRLMLFINMRYQLLSSSSNPAIRTPILSSTLIPLYFQGDSSL